MWIFLLVGVVDLGHVGSYPWLLLWVGGCVLLGLRSGASLVMGASRPTSHCRDVVRGSFTKV